jgi:hypothetical protein
MNFDQYYFCIITLESGLQFPAIRTTDYYEYILIEYLATLELAKSNHVYELILIVKESIEHSECNYFYSNNNIDIRINNSITILVEDSALLRKCQFSTTEFLNILEKWLKFLLLYEAGRIPNITNAEANALSQGLKPN